MSDQNIGPADLFRLHGRTALVTGASRGIGATAARVLDAAGARVVLVARDAARLADVAGTLAHEPVVLPADLLNEDSCDRLPGRAKEAVGGVDVLVNNAGLHRPAVATELRVDDWEAVNALNLRAAFLLARGFAGEMAGRGWGKVINVASVMGLVGDVGASAYIATKAGLLGLTRALGTEWAAQGVTVNALCPGWVDTEMVDQLKGNPAFERRLLRRVPVRRWGRTEDLAGALLLLATPASDFMVGQAIVVDGGLTTSW